MRVKERTGKAYKRDELPRSEDEKNISVVQGKLSYTKWLRSRGEHAGVPGRSLYLNVTRTTPGVERGKGSLLWAHSAVSRARANHHSHLPFVVFLSPFSSPSFYPSLPFPPAARRVGQISPCASLGQREKPIRVLPFSVWTTRKEEEEELWLYFRCVFKGDLHGTEKRGRSHKKTFTCQGDMHIRVTVTCSRQVDKHRV